MTAKIPIVQRFLKKTPNNSRPGMAGKVAVIGAFDSDITDPQVFFDLNDAYEVLGDDTSFKGCACLDELFYGASSIIAVNITTWTGSGESKTPNKELTTTKLSEALAKIKGEDFDLLFVAETIQSTAVSIINTFTEEVFQNKYPCGYIIGVNTTDANTILTMVNNWCYGVVTQQLEVNGNELSLPETSAYYTGVIASLNVGNSMTMKTVPNVTGVTPEYTFETGDRGKQLVEAGGTVFKCQSRENDRYVVVNSEQPNGLDLYINRTRDFVCKEFALHQFLGERNREATLSVISQEVDRVKNMCVNTLDLLEDIEYTVEKKSSDCVDINITKLLFAGIITEIDVYISIEVE